ncbi:400_t:CDS:2, partial [Dentiscutata heterogama]
ITILLQLVCLALIRRQDSHEFHCTCWLMAWVQNLSPEMDVPKMDAPKMATPRMEAPEMGASL